MECPATSDWKNSKSVKSFLRAIAARCSAARCGGMTAMSGQRSWIVSRVRSCITACPFRRSSTVLIVSGAVSAITVVTDLNLRDASSSAESTR